MKFSLVRISLLAALVSGIPGFVMAQNTDAAIKRLPKQLYVTDIKTLTASDTDTGDFKSLSHLKNLADSKRARLRATDDYDGAVRGFIESNSANFGLENNAATLKLKGIRSGLTGTYVEYHQEIEGIPVIDSQLGVAMDNEGTVTSISRNIVDVPMERSASVAKTATITEDAALEVVGGDLKPSGKVIAAPTISKAYLNENNVMTLVYVIQLAVQEPFGYWEYRIDSQTGRIIEKFDRRIQEDKKPGAGFVDQSSGELTPIDLTKAIQEKTAKKAMAAPGAKIATAKATVFNPNPVTSLNDSTLLDNSDESRFAAAYIQVDLSNVTESGGQFSLTGPSVRIEDFEPGVMGRDMPPSTSTGVWTATRGDNAFNDVMTYHYLNQSIEYLRRMGYSGAAELFPNGIAADSDGVNGSDNSHYVPGANVLAFGHGCVDDNEDTDVILHELGHAIHSLINPSWQGGDSGAIGEGFGDYWAVRYRKRLVAGTNPDPGKVFPWDGIDSCWGGRRFDITNAIYDPSKTYRAHQFVDGFVADELWSTPLLNALSDLQQMGISVESFDKVVLEGMRDIGSNFTMRELAANTVSKAEALFPGTPIAEMMTKRFKEHQILP